MQVQKDSLQILDSETAWLNDEIIDAIRTMIIQVNENDSFDDASWKQNILKNKPSLYIFNSFESNYLIANDCLDSEENSEDIQKNHRKFFECFSKHYKSNGPKAFKFLFPICYANHWFYI